MKKRIYLAHPISLGSPDVNMHNLIEACQDVWKLGHYAYGAFFNLFWEAAYPKTRRQYLDHDLGWLAVCDIVWRLPGESTGADEEVDFAQKVDIPIVYSLRELKKCLTLQKKLEKNTNHI